MIKTLAQIIADGDYKNSRRYEGMHLDTYVINNALYGGSREYDYDHEEAFEKNEKVHTYDIQTWVCTDTSVGLNLIEVNDEPLALTWQAFRKSSQEMLFLSEDARNKFRTAWERNAPAREVDSLISPELLNAPFGKDDDFTFGFDTSFEYPQISRESVLGVFDQIKRGFADYNPETVSAVAQAAREMLDAAERALVKAKEHAEKIPNVGHLDAETKKDLLVWALEDVNKTEMWIELLRNSVLPTFAGVIDAPSPEM